MESGYASDDASSSEEDDHLSTRSQDTDTGQEISDNGDDLEPLSSYWVGKDGTMWSKEPERSNVRKRSENVVKSKPGVNRHARDAKDLISCWELFITPALQQIIVKFTNQHIAKRRESVKAEHYKKYVMGDTSVEEIKALYGLLYLAGLFHSNKQRLTDLWRDDGTGIEFFRKTLPIRRVQFLLGSLRFDDKTTRFDRKSIDNLAPIREIIEMFVLQCKSVYTPHPILTIDEMLPAFRGRCKFRQYIPNKPSKYGIKMQAMVDNTTYYTVNLEVYCGKQPVGPYECSNKAIDVVQRLISPISKTSRHITFDDWYYTQGLANTLLQQHKLTITATMRKNKPEIPPTFLQPRGRAVGSSLFGFQKNLSIVSYIPRKGKVVLVASTLHHDSSIDLDTGDKQKPEMITFYNSSKGGVDIVDQMCSAYDVARNTLR